MQVQRRHAELGYTAVASFPLAADYLNGQRLPGGVNPREWDGFHDLVVIDELARCGYLGIIWALGCGNSIGGPPVINFGNAEQKQRFLPDMLSGKVRFCLGVTEPDGELSLHTPRNTGIRLLTGFSDSQLDLMSLVSLRPPKGRAMCISSMVPRSGLPMASSQTTVLQLCELVEKGHMGSLP